MDGQPLGLEQDKRKPSLTEEEIFAVLSRMPDFDRFPLPAHWYKKFNIPLPKVQTLKESLRLHTEIQNAPGDGRPIEIRPVAPGGVRPIIDVPQLQVTISPENVAQEPLTPDFEIHPLNSRQEAVETPS